MNTNGQRPQRHGDRGGRYINRFAGDALINEGLKSDSDGPRARKLTSEVAWKRPPSASVRAEVSA